MSKSSAFSAAAFFLLFSFFSGGAFARPQPKQVNIVYVTLTIGDDGLPLPTPQPVAYGYVPSQKAQGVAYVPVEETVPVENQHVGYIPRPKSQPLVDNPTVNNPVVDTSIVNTPVVDTPTVDTPVVDTPIVNTPAMDTPVVNTPVVDTPVVSTPVVNTPVVNTPVVDTPVVPEKPSVKTPAADVSVTKNPTVNTPLVDTSVVNNPVANTPTVDPSAANIVEPPTLQNQPAYHPQKSTTSKRGLAYNDKSPSLDIFLSHPKITWAHCWSALDFSLPPQLEFVPTLTDLSAYSTSHWSSQLQSALSRKTTTPAAKTQYVMSFNEPDQHDQIAFMDPSAAAAAYKQYISPLSSRSIKLGSPSITNGVVPGMGLNYLSSFLSACGTDCPIDFIPVHWYGCPDGACPVSEDVALFKKQITDATIAAEGKPVWIPEFQRLGDQEGQVEFLSEVLPWLDADEQGQIERYAYFMVAEGFLLEGGGLSKVGEIYVS